MVKVYGSQLLAIKLQALQAFGILKLQMRVLRTKSLRTSGVYIAGNCVPVQDAEPDFQNNFCGVRYNPVKTRTLVFAVLKF